jgi:cell division protein FtsL
MAETVALVLLIVAIVEAFVIHAFNFDYKQLSTELATVRQQRDQLVQGIAKQGREARPQAVPKTALQMARPVHRTSWQDIRARVEGLSEEDPEQSAAYESRTTN